MSGQFDYWGLLAGIALFLFAMAQLESGLKSLGGRSLAFYLKSQADRRINSVIGGIVSTALLQSSSVVGLMVLAFTGAGLLNLTTALGIVFGSNLGTTLTGWIVATIGFKFEIFELCLPLIALGGLSFLFGRGSDLPAMFARVHPVHRTPYRVIQITGVIMLIATLTLPIKDIAAAADIIFLLVFVLVCATVIRLRRTWADHPRPFRVALVPALPIIGMFAGVILSVGLIRISLVAWITAAGWIAVGFIVHRLKGTRAWHR